MSALGPEGRRFESYLPDQKTPVLLHSSSAPSGNARRNESRTGTGITGISPECFSGISPRDQIMERRRNGYSAPQNPEQTTTIQRKRVSKQARQYVYFIRHSDGPIKIGYATNVTNRLKGMQTAHYAELILIAVRTGGRKREAEYHARYAEHHLRGEWFSPHPDILAEVARINKLKAFRVLLEQAK